MKKMRQINGLAVEGVGGSNEKRPFLLSQQRFITTWPEINLNLSYCPVNMDKYQILVVEDDELQALSMVSLLKKELADSQIYRAVDSASCEQFLSKKNPDLCFLDMDLKLPLEGLEIIKKLPSNCYKVVLTSHKEQELVLESYSLGCQDFIHKPLSGILLKNIVQKFILSRNKNSCEELKNKFLTHDQNYLNQLKNINRWALSDTPLLILGPTGSGKSYLAKEIHRKSKENQGELIHLNCAEIPEALFEGELFGFKKGSFTGALNDKKGKLTLAHNGTLFLDEISAMPLTVQQKFLRVLEEKNFYPLGCEEMVYSNFRLMAATCDDLEEMVKQKKFRSDLYFRLKGEKIIIPALSERKKDIEIIIRNFLAQNPRKIVFTDKLVEKLKNYSWPGNTRELLLALSNLVNLDKGIVDQDDWQSPDMFESDITSIDLKAIKERVLEEGLSQVIQEIESELLLQVFKENNFKVRETMRQMKLSNATFYKILERSKVKL